VLAVEVDRNGETLRFDVTIGTRLDATGASVGALGVGIGDDPRESWYFRQFGPGEAIGQAISRTWNSSVFTVQMLSRMITGDVSSKNISGPLNIAKYAGEAAMRGLDDFVRLLAIVSISLGILNLLPIPVLDGGQIVYQTVEWVKGSPMSERAQLIGQQIGIVALMLLIGFAFFNDFNGLLK